MLPETNFRTTKAPDFFVSDGRVQNLLEGRPDDAGHFGGDPVHHRVEPGPAGGK